MPSNIEVKMSVVSLTEVERRAIEMGATPSGLLVQRDTFYRCSSGRLKLREITQSHAELIAYARDDHASVRTSDYAIARVEDPAAMHEVLARSLGVSGVVAKKRTLLLWRNVRIHLDRVDGLGEFIEFESVVGPTDAETAAANLDELMRGLGLESATIVPVAYVDLLLSRAGDTSARS